MQARKLQSADARLLNSPQSPISRLGHNDQQTGVSHDPVTQTLQHRRKTDAYAYDTQVIGRQC